MRRTDREVTDPADVRSILESAKILHLGLKDEEFPYIVPLHYGYEFGEDSLIFYMHSAKEGHKLDLIRQDARVCAEIDSPWKLVSGGDIACKYGAKFASVIARGTAEIVTDEAEKIKGLTLLMEHQTGRVFEFNSQMAEAVEVIKVTAGEWSAKARR